MTSRLNPEDQRMSKSTCSFPRTRVERKPFRPWLLLVLVLVAVIGLGLLSRLLSYLTL
jgi:cytoskeletal protein RodZ